MIDRELVASIAFVVFAPLRNDPPALVIKLAETVAFELVAWLYATEREE